jgi:hypothetical protein
VRHGELRPRRVRSLKMRPIAAAGILLLATPAPGRTRLSSAARERPPAGNGGRSSGGSGPATRGRRRCKLQPTNARPWHRDDLSGAQNAGVQHVEARIGVA